MQLTIWRETNDSLDRHKQTSLKHKFTLQIMILTLSWKNNTQDDFLEMNVSNYFGKTFWLLVPVHYYLRQAFQVEEQRSRIE